MLKDLLKEPTFWTIPIFFGVLAFVIYLMSWSEEQTTQASNWCEEQGGYALTERGMFRVCLDRNVVIPTPERVE
jgi:hypothetical protein